MIYACKETREVWQALCRSKAHSRTLALERFVDFPNSEKDTDWRRRTCESIRTGQFFAQKIRHWGQFIDRLAGKPERILVGRLQSRLVLNAAGGVLENGGMCLDRISGIPFIPGSAVKGCARRSAIAELAEVAPDKKAGLLEAVALVFGWTEQGWSDETNMRGQRFSDFRPACGQTWADLREQVARRLCQRFGVAVQPGKPAWKQLPNFAGAVNFLPAYPRNGDPGIELDVVTCHHKKYYMDYMAEPGHEIALDDENPEPIVFPVTKAVGEPEFAFVVLANGNGVDDLENLARRWLQKSLETFGIGGKTAAGYGWFQFGPKPASLAAPPTQGTGETLSSRQPSEHPLIRQWRGRATRENFPAILPQLAAIGDVEELRRLFEAIIPENERHRLRTSNPYWQSFRSRPQGQQILQRLGIQLQ
ncbi:MAG: type III-B CRISPR module RAMP protein Cmr6 [Verrucomicrobia bacterium]|nr:type III-B CRISPR module RAMP protein Cmr6 [Verrucomicrobiota bacterium]